MEGSLCTSAARSGGPLVFCYLNQAHVPVRYSIRHRRVIYVCRWLRRPFRTVREGLIFRALAAVNTQSPRTHRAACAPESPFHLGNPLAAMSSAHAPVAVNVGLFELTVKRRLRAAPWSVFSYASSTPWRLGNELPDSGCSSVECPLPLSSPSPSAPGEGGAVQASVPLLPGPAHEDHTHFPRAKFVLTIS